MFQFSVNSNLGHSIGVLILRFKTAPTAHNIHTFALPLYLGTIDATPVMSAVEAVDLKSKTVPSTKQSARGSQAAKAPEKKESSNEITIQSPRTL